jgi:hypothetical protein
VEDIRYAPPSDEEELKRDFEQDNKHNLKAVAGSISKHQEDDYIDE